MAIHSCMSFEALKPICMHETVKFSLLLSWFGRVTWSLVHFSFIRIHQPQLWSGKKKKGELVTLPKPMFVCSIFIVLFKIKKINVKWYHSVSLRGPLFTCTQENKSYCQKFITLPHAYFPYRMETFIGAFQNLATSI